MRRDGKTPLEKMLQGERTSAPPAGLLDRLRGDIPADVRPGDIERKGRERYFSQVSPWLAAASLLMLFSFTFLISRVTFLNDTREPDLATVIEKSHGDLTKISESAAEQVPVGAAVRRRPPATEPTEAAAADSAAEAPGERFASVPQVMAESAPPPPAVARPAIMSRESAVETDLMKEEASGRIQLQRPAGTHSASNLASRAEMAKSTPAALPPSRNSSLEDSARQTIVTNASPLLVLVPRAAVLHRERLSSPLELPAEVRVSFTIDDAGRVTSALVGSELDESVAAAVVDVLMEWTFETGRASTFDLIVDSDDLQPDARD